MKCNYYYIIYKLNDETYASRNHLFKKHEIDFVNRQVVATTIYDESIKIALLRLSKKKQERKNKQFNINIIKNINKQHLKYLYIK